MSNSTEHPVGAMDPQPGVPQPSQYIRLVVSSYFQDLLERYNTAIERYRRTPSSPKPLFGSVDGRLVKYNPNTDEEESYSYPGFGTGFDISDLPVCPLCRRPFDDKPNAQYFSFLHNLMLKKNALPSRPPSPSPKVDEEFTGQSYETSNSPLVITPFGYPLGQGFATNNVNSNEIEADKYKNEEMEEHGKENGFTSSSIPSSTSEQATEIKAGSSGSSGYTQTYSSLNTNCIIDGYYNRFFREVRVLGSGSFGDVFLVEHIISGMTVGEYALKRVAVGDSIEWLCAALKEVTSLESISHPNVLSYKHCWVENSQFNKWSPRVPFLFILTSLADAGSLDVLISMYDKNSMQYNSRSTENSDDNSSMNKPKNNLSQDKGSGEKTNDSNGNTMNALYAAIIFKGAARGLAHLHKLGLLHRDIKPSNILLVRDKNEGGLHLRALLGDLAQCMRADCLPPNHTGATGTIGYAAPEVKAGGMCSYASDVYALGISLKETISVCTVEHDKNSVFQKLVDLVASMTVTNPEQRPTTNEVVAQLKLICRC